ncbi:hypothetical protein ACVNS2_05135 [Paenibacillus caseinilyticus]|uniref:Uncharacterized protein n=1 Tax=Paenibacillus mucilaginosus K02 TaxID=997761 RepID=I0BCF7_9BACL|nr:hypothetical protein [Paenibacillus mucilaginosus]AFH60054.1 hypothetical protein B2K_04845 [Paenibacillus mucilaginosus K02]
MITAVGQVTGIYRSQAQWQEAEERRLLHIADAAAARRKPVQTPPLRYTYDRQAESAARKMADVYSAAEALGSRPEAASAERRLAGGDAAAVHQELTELAGRYNRLASALDQAGGMIQPEVRLALQESLPSSALTGLGISLGEDGALAVHESKLQQLLQGDGASLAKTLRAAETGFTEAVRRLTEARPAELLERRSGPYRPDAGSAVERRKLNPYEQGLPVSFTGLLLDTFV